MTDGSGSNMLQFGAFDKPKPSDQFRQYPTAESVTLAFGAIPSLFVAYEHTWWDTAALYQPIASLGFNYMWQRQSDAVKGGDRVRFGSQ